MKKCISLLLIAVMCSFVIVGCGNKGTGPNGVDAVSGTSKAAESSNSSGSSSSEDVAVEFVNSLMSADYKTALDCLGLEEGKSFLVEDDIDFYLPRSSYACVSDLKTTEGIKVVASDYKKSSNSSATVTVTFVNDEGNAVNSVPVKTALNDENKWVVEADEFYNTNYSFRTAGGNVDLVVNGIKVSEDLCSNTSAGDTGLSKEYTLPYVGKKTINVKLSCDNYTYDTELSTSSNNEIGDDDKAFYILKDAEQTEVFTAVKDIWNSLYSDFKKGNKPTDELNYIAKYADPDICSQIWDGFKSMQSGFAGGDSLRNVNFNLTKVKSRSDGDTFWVTDNKMVVNFDYELTWEYLLTHSIYSTKRHSNILLSKEDDDFKIYTLIDTGLFTESNNFTQEW